MSAADAAATQQRENLRLWRQNLDALTKYCWEQLKNPTLEGSERIEMLRLILDALIEQRKELGHHPED